MAQACLRCLKLTMCAANFLCFICGISVLSLGIYMLVKFKMGAITQSLIGLNVAHILIITGIVITCLSFLGFLGALKENRCLLLTFFLLLFLLMLVELAAACLLLFHDKEIPAYLEKYLKEELKKAKQQHNDTTLTEWDLIQTGLHCCGVVNVTDWQRNIPESCCDGPCDSKTPNYYKQGCLKTMQDFFEEHFLYIGIAVIVLCIIEVLGMCFAMTLYCHISRSGLGYRL